MCYDSLLGFYKEMRVMSEKIKQTPDQLSVYIPQRWRKHGIIERLTILADNEHRSISQMAVVALLDYLERADA